MDGNGQGGLGRARGRGRATAQAVRPAGRRPGDSATRPQHQPAPAPTQSAWGRPQGQSRPGPSQAPQPRQPFAAPRPSAPQPSQGEGRATLHRVQQPHHGSEEAARPSGTGDNNRGVSRGKRVINEIIKTKPSGIVSKRGSSGREVSLVANYFRAVKKPTWHLYQYRVDFSPDIELMRLRKGLLSEHRATFGGYLFDGTILFIAHRLQNDPMELVSKNRAGDPFKITVKFVGLVEMTDGQSVQVLNLILRRAMEGLKLQLVGRNFFDAIAKVDLREHRIELWPGYTTSIRQHEQDILLCAEIAHKVMRTDRIYDILQRCVQESRDYQDYFKKEVIGMVVLTDYNNKTYRIDDVDFDAKPRSTFPTKDGDISYVDYYANRYNIKITDPNQPLLVSRSTERNLRSGQTEFIMLVPELCRATGLNDQMRNNFRLMRAMADHTRLAPAMRIDRLKAFNSRLYATPESIEVLNSWQLTLDKNLVEMSGRILNPERIVFGGGAEVASGPGADWTRDLRSNSMFTIAHLQNWFVIVPTRSQREAHDFVKSIIKAGEGMRMRIAEPKFVPIQDDRNHSYVNAIEKCCSQDPQLLMIVVPNNNAERYSCIKKKTCVERSVPSQVVVFKTIAPRGGNTRGLMSVATKVVIQMNCKLGCVPWLIKIPLSGLMCVGFDVCHSARDVSKSYGALVATMDLKVSARFFSAVSVHNKGQELSNEIGLSMTKALKEYRELHGTLPQRILFYRDGVGEGQLHQVIETEIVNLRKRLDKIYEEANVKEGCRLCFIVVSKRINTRYFLDKQNPPPGTVADDVITLPERYDFFLVSQSVREGTVSPTSYNIIYDNIGLDADKLQLLTYKMCHLYYNWSGTVRVPAMCQYAHKLSFLVAQSIHQCPSSVLDKQLYFL